MHGVLFFDSVDHLEPRCKKCGTKIELDVTTEYDEKKGAVVCKECGNII